MIVRYPQAVRDKPQTIAQNVLVTTSLSLTLFVIFALLYVNFGRVTETLIVMLAVPFAFF